MNPTAERIAKSAAAGLVTGALVYATSLILGTAHQWPGALFASGMTFLTAMNYLRRR